MHTQATGELGEQKEEQQSHKYLWDSWKSWI